MKKTNKILSIFLAILMVISISPLTASAATYSGTCGSDVTWKYNISTYTLTISGTGAMYDYYYNNRPWEEYEDDIKKVVINNGVTTIGTYAFYGCDKITSVTIGDSVTSIGEYAFSDCDSLTSVTIGDSVILIGYNAFGWCKSLTSITIPDSVTTIDGWAFQRCYSLTNVTIGDSVKAIGNYVFYDCTSLTNITVDSNNKYYSNNEYDGVLFNKNKTTLIQYPIGNTRANYTIPDSVTTIGVGAFENCSSLTSVTIPDSVKVIDNYAFDECTSLTSATIPDSVTTIGNYAFYGCESLTSLTIPDSITKICNSAFSGCTSLTSVIIPDSVKIIDNYAFDECTSLTSVIIPDSVKTIGEYAFYGCESLTSVTIPDSITTIGEYVFCGCESLTSVTIPNSVTTISKNAFSGCDSLTTITIPVSVQTISLFAFGGCDGLTEFIVDSNNKYYSSDEYGVLFNKNKTTLIQYPIGNTRTNYTIPESVTSIGNSAFYYCDNLTSVTIGDNVTTIGDYAFFDCDNFTSFTIGDSVNTIGISAFLGCESLTSVTIPVSVKTIGILAFEDCESLTNVYYVGTAAQWENISIGIRNQNLTKATIHYNHIHEYILVITSPTCTEQGYTTYTCECGDSYIDDYVDALGHEYDSVVTDPTCTEQGYTTYTCECGDSYIDNYVDALEHDMITYEAVAPDCVNTGLTEGSHCSRCDGATTEQKIIPALGHSYDTVITEPTHSQQGYTTYTCACGYSYVDNYTDALGYADYFELRLPTISKVRYLDTIVLHADFDGELPDGAYVEWTVDNENFSTKELENSQLEITSRENGETVFTATLYTADGTAVATDTVTMTSRANIFEKIGGFFRNLFGATLYYIY